MGIPGVEALETEGVDFVMQLANSQLVSARRIIRELPTRCHFARRKTSLKITRPLSTSEFAFEVHDWDGDTFLNYMSWHPDMTHMNWPNTV